MQQLTKKKLQLVKIGSWKDLRITFLQTLTRIKQNKVL